MTFLLQERFLVKANKKNSTICQFCCISYISWWLTAPLSSNDPKNDQLFFNSLFDYKTIDSVIANEALLRLETTCGILLKSLYHCVFLATM